MNSFSKLKWRCRRGTKELDFLLERFLINQFARADQKEQLLFIELLDLQDSQLILYLLGNQLPKARGLSDLVKKIRKQPAIRD